MITFLKDLNFKYTKMQTVFIKYVCQQITIKI